MRPASPTQRLRLASAILAFSFAATPRPAAANSAIALNTSVDLPALVEKVLPGVVNISATTFAGNQVQGMEDFLRFWGVPQEQKQSSLGTGFLIDKDGFILTNNHVVERADEVLVTLVDKRIFRAKIIGKDPKTDLALIRIRDKEGKAPGNLSPVPLGDSEAVRIAEPVFAVGNPFGLSHTVTMGIISAKNRTIGLGPFDNFLQTDASINPGNSGGPLFNLKGEVVGINTVIYSRTGQSGGLGFAIPANEAKEIVPDLKRYQRVPRPWLGVLGQKVTPALSEYVGLAVSSGVLVYNLVSEGPADAAGVRPGDVILAIDGSDVSEPNDLEKALAKKRPTDSVKVKVRRGRRSLDLSFRLEELPRLSNLPQGIL